MYTKYTLEIRIPNFNAVQFANSYPFLVSDSSWCDEQTLVHTSQCNGTFAKFLLFLKSNFL